MNRRTFLKLAGMGSVSFAVGCSSEPEKTLFSLVRAPDDMVTGKPAWYASTCRECPAGCGILAKNREGRVIKVEGNPNHPINRGKLCMRGQAALQAVYNPDRIKSPLLKEKNGHRSISFSHALALIKEKSGALSRQGPNRVHLLTEMVGAGLTSLFNEALGQWNSGPALVFEPFAYESLKTANRKIFNIEGLPSYRMERADFLLAFGADFLETWLSPVEYARKFKAMHHFEKGRKNLFYAIGPYQSLTAANADAWLSCSPGGEALIALSLVNNLLFKGRGHQLPQPLRDSIRRAVLPYTKELAVQRAGITPDAYERLLGHLARAHSPLVLGTGSGTRGPNSLQTDMAANLLNLVLDPELSLLDFDQRHYVESAAGRADILKFFSAVAAPGPNLLFLNNVDPVFSIPPAGGIADLLREESLFVVCLSNFMTETAALADLILPTRMPLETWDEYTGKRHIRSALQPAMGRITAAPHVGDVFLKAAFSPEKGARFAGGYKTYLLDFLSENIRLQDEKQWVSALRSGGFFYSPLEAGGPIAPPRPMPRKIQVDDFKDLIPPASNGLKLIIAPSLRYFDGRGANKSWLNEIPDPLTQVAWQTPLRIHPRTLAQYGLREEDIVRLKSSWGVLEAPVYQTEHVGPGIAVMDLGQGHRAFGRYAHGKGSNPYHLFPAQTDPVSGGPYFYLESLAVEKTSRSLKLARTDGSRFQHGRKIALSITAAKLKSGKPPAGNGLTMDDFPLTLPLPEGYHPKRDIYPAHDHKDYRWAMVVDLDRCIGCGACMAACYAENNLGVVGPEQIRLGREMSWIRIERYLDPDRPEKVIFFPMLCQHCDNAPCESVCPVYAPHHSIEGLNNQIYNRCIGTRFCSQNCPYKVRRFNWFNWDWPEPLNLQLNPDVTVRSKGVMEKCSFCIQRIKQAHNAAKNENRKIKDGEIQPACLQSCPPGALTFGNLMDPNSRVRRLVADPRAYQVMGYLNTKPAVIYLKKLVRED